MNNSSLIHEADAKIVALVNITNEQECSEEYLQSVIESRVVEKVMRLRREVQYGSKISRDKQYINRISSILGIE